MKNNLKKLAFEKKITSLFDIIKQSKFSNFQIIFLVYAVIFSLFLFLSLPSLFNYKNYYKQIKEEAYSEFKLNLNNINNVKYRFVPLPHLLIEGSEIQLEKNTDSKIADLKNMKIFISIWDLYRDKKISVKRILIKKGNFYFDKNNLNLFQNHLNFKITKPIKIENSNFFYKNHNKEIVTISPIRNLNYYIDLNSKEKRFNITGKLFDLDYVYSWKKNYLKPNFINSLMEVKNPTIRIENNIEKINDKKKIGDLKLFFLGNDVNINYKYDNELLNFETKNNKNSKYGFNGSININPFFFDINLDLKNQDFNFILDYLLQNLYEFKENIHENLNGFITINFSNMKQDLFKSGKVKMNLKDSKINILDNNFNIKKIGNFIINSSNFVLKQDQLFFNADVKMNIKNKNEFYRLFLVPKELRFELSEIYFKLEKNLDNNNYVISDLSFNKKNDSNNESLIKYEFSNIQQLRGVVREVFRLVK